ncbi:hypothetical protein P22_0777 [Propionispora sp. 2/2-37]|uniref:HAD family hydrolase n=1 Tax=Propionispora sp. 2/2-37 TaxID=1677858 RepID=UPI0006BB7AF9|nr:HAD family hydrolase [Propionispora sp. 2/2-37]CUH94711.1 hypothetical protein P22_0777 [Propionispora sp. 2/2-37]
MKYSGILFDLDGTLLDTLDDLANSMNVVLQKHGFPVHDTEKYKYFIGNGMETLVKRVLPAANSEDKKLREACLEEFRTEYGRRWHEQTKPYDGINQLLDALETKGIQLSVLSNKADSFTRIIIERYFGSQRFRFVFGAREGVPKKPDPGSALEIAGLSGIPAAKYLYLGDSGVDMQTATAAGMYAVGAAWGFREEEELLQNGARVVIKQPEELLALL